jgi:hypothetical protein
MKHGILMRIGHHAADAEGSFGKQPPSAEEREARWQKHVVMGLWLLLALLIAVAGILIAAEAQGYLDRAANREPPAAAALPN